MVPTLRHGDIVIMDNLGSLKSHAVRRAISAAGAEILARSEPDRAVLRQVQALATQAAQRTTEACYNAIAPILQTFTPTECANYFVNAGYDQT